MDYSQIIQGSPEWFAARLGKVTASRVADIVARTKTGVSASRANYRAQLVCERLTGLPQESFKSPAMDWGTQTEPDARAAYEFETGRKVETIGFVGHPGFRWAGASPDGLVGEDGLIEIKCPLTATHIETLLGKAVPGRYICQMQWQLACTGRQWCDFVSYDPRLPGHLQLGVYRLERDPQHIADLEAAVGSFLDEVQAVIDQLEGL
jgi:putative phage-type endonuclease